ncbi:N-formylglutamate deformylase [Xanthomonas sontii]|uniref:N-formylglutamate deformylase n=1 Tax=Xanthomonas sontii TaxID=2650745 RepID=A0A6N7Q3S8_9XANT|nr:N-formylglutamate deformylase [Xanthomonas sontii]MDQ7758532.1 N-formylglutamate deformylase [Xanthomonas sontii]MRG99072.1 N-formylglutamate deformylase [Xanthomonas sontii]MRH73137.1 N-formylglutamate deformylase [Xanthomonas sontii]TYD35963.1 N-formylglutamate deformylase [Xanthomonas sontii]UZK06960.1 N-formylglutamate deformylase [Xanthomonas sontii]
MTSLPDWLSVHRGDAPLILSFPHTGTDLPEALADRFVSPWLAQRDADWWVHLLYDFAETLGATIVRTAISRSVIDVNRDPAGVSLYPGQNTTGLCPLTTFDAQPLYRLGAEPDATEIDARRAQWFAPYHAALDAEIARLRALHPAIVVYDAHSIRSRIPHLFDGELPQFNIGSAGASGAVDSSCAAALTDAVERVCAGSGFSHVRNGRFKGGWSTRHHGAPADGVHAIQMELACRGYMHEPDTVDPGNWPSPWQPEYAAPLRAVLQQVLQACLYFVRSPAASARAAN